MADMIDRHGTHGTDRGQAGTVPALETSGLAGISNTTSSTLRYAFLATSGVLLLAALLLFLFAEAVATLPANTRSGNLWPWPIGPLAVRFLASLLLSGALVSAIAARRPDRPTLFAFSSVVAIISGMLLLHAIVNIGSIVWSKPLAYIWMVLLVLAFIVSIITALRLGVLRRTQSLGPKGESTGSTPSSGGSSLTLPATPPAARYIAQVIFVLTGLVGGTMFFFPGFAKDLWPWDLANHTNVQLLGAVFLSVSLSSLFSVLQPSWYGFDLFYPAAGTFATAALVASFMHWNLFAAKPLTSAVFVGIYVLGAIFGFYPYFRYALSYSRRKVVV